MGKAEYSKEIIFNILAKHFGGEGKAKGREGKKCAGRHLREYNNCEQIWVFNDGKYFSTEPFLFPKKFTKRAFWLIFPKIMRIEFLAIIR